MPWICAGLCLDTNPRPLVMGVLNVTPDSFSDGGQFDDADRALAAAHAMIEAGADIIDVGGESSRPGSAPVPETEELRRVAPVLERLIPACPIPVSIDTSKPAVARRALQIGARIVNDVGAAEDPAMIQLLAEVPCGYVLMHRKGSPATMQAAPSYRDVVAEIHEFLSRRLGELARAGIDPARVALDPGFGFGKTWEHNRQILLHLPELATMGRPLLIGLSRKSFVGQITGDPPPHRTAGSLAAETLAMWLGAGIVRTHDVPSARRAAAAVAAIQTGSIPPIPPKPSH
ncbi:MAG: dihydropteroate synthase [Verrucomicrobiae bacterium]|nr:dihydropteroate synthase [Verrucomicrobiae bacterium]